MTAHWHTPPGTWEKAEGRKKEGKGKRNEKEKPKSPVVKVLF